MKTVELFLKKGKLVENGKIDESDEELSKGSNKVLITVHNTGIPNTPSLSTRDAEFEDGPEYVFEDQYKVNNEEYLTTFFRGNAYGRFYVEVEVTSVTKPTKAAKVIQKLISRVSESTFGLVPGGEIITSAVKTIGSSLVELIGTEDKIQVLGHGVEGIDVDNLPNEIEIPLIVPKDVKMTKVSYEPRIGQQKRKDRAIRNFQKKKLKADTPNGSITLGIKSV